jgi:hypothetical protein
VDYPIHGRKLMNNRQSYHYKTAAEKAAAEEAAERKLQMQKIAKATAKRMITRRAQQAENKARREKGQRKTNKAKRAERHPGLTTAEIRAKREAKGLVKPKKEKKKSGGGVAGMVGGIFGAGRTLAKSRNKADKAHSAAVKEFDKSKRKANRTPAERKENRRKKGRGRFAK